MIGLYFTKQLVNRGELSPRRTIHVLLTSAAPRRPFISDSIHIAITEPVGSGRLRIGSRGGRQKRNAQLVGIFGSKAEGRRKDPRLVLAARVFGVQAISGKLLAIDDRLVAAQHPHPHTLLTAGVLTTHVSKFLGHRNLATTIRQLNTTSRRLRLALQWLEQARGQSEEVLARSSRSP